jgi:hypothetical protein
MHLVQQKEESILQMKKHFDFGISRIYKIKVRFKSNFSQTHINNSSNDEHLFIQPAHSLLKKMNE